jgi:hypothetical protein
MADDDETVLDWRNRPNSKKTAREYRAVFLFFHLDKRKNKRDNACKHLLA